MTMKWSHGDDHKSQTAVGLCFGVFVKTSPCLWLTVKSREACAKGFLGTPPRTHRTKKRKENENERPKENQHRACDHMLGDSEEDIVTAQGCETK